jgi:hypothetical protein
MIRQQPDKLLILTTGNINNNQLIDLFIKSLPQLAELFKQHSLDLLQKSENTLKPSASIGVCLPDICGCSVTRRFLQEVY